MSDEPNRIFVGSFEGGLDILIIPAEALKQANDRLDAEREKRLAEAALEAARTKPTPPTRRIVGLFGGRASGFF